MRFVKVSAVLLLALSAVPAVAQDVFPSQRVRLVVSFPPGGSTDVFARILAQKLSAHMNAAVIVDNRAGANGNIGNESVARAAPDGQTLLFNTSAVVLSIALGEKLSYNVQKDLAAVALVASVPLVLTAHPLVPVENVSQFIAHVKANPNKLAYGSAGTGNITHLGNLMFLEANGLFALHVPYKGASPALTDVLGGRLQFATTTIVSSAPLVKSKRLKGLAVTSVKRSALLPEVPTLAEGVMPGFEVGAWYGVMAPTRTPQAIVQRLNTEIVKALQDADARSRLVQEGAEILASTPERYAAYLASELDRWSQLIKRTGVKAE
jgi:tripartite-type tricarboxylate transporter receptor subunit TctC